MAEAQSLKAGTIRGLSSDLTGPAAAVGVRRANQQAAAKITELVAPTTRNVAAKTGLVDKGIIVNRIKHKRSGNLGRYG